MHRQVKVYGGFNFLQLFQKKIFKPNFKKFSQNLSDNTERIQIDFNINLKFFPGKIQLKK